MKVFLAEDDKSIIDVMQIILTEQGHEVMTIHDVSRIEQEIITAAPDIIFLDISLFGKSGGDLAMRLKNGPLKTTPLIIVSANPETKHIAREVGADDFLSKPFDLEELIGKVTSFTAR